MLSREPVHAVQENRSTTHAMTGTVLVLHACVCACVRVVTHKTTASDELKRVPSPHPILPETPSSSSAMTNTTAVTVALF